MSLKVVRSSLSSKRELNVIKQQIEATCSSLESPLLSSSVLEILLNEVCGVHSTATSPLVTEFVSQLHALLNSFVSPDGWNVLLTGRAGFALRYRLQSFVLFQIKNSDTNVRSAMVLIYRSPANVPLNTSSLLAARDKYYGAGSTGGESSTVTTASKSQNSSLLSFKFVTLETAKPDNPSSSSELFCPDDIRHWGFLDLDSKKEQERLICTALSQACCTFNNEKEDFQTLAQRIAFELSILAGPLWTVVVTKDPDSVKWKTTYSPTATFQVSWCHPSTKVRYTAVGFQLCGKRVSSSLNTILVGVPYALLATLCVLWLLKSNLCKSEVHTTFPFLRKTLTAQ